MKKIRLHWFAPEHGKLKTKLLWVFFLLVVLPLGLFTLYAYFRIRSVAREQTFSAAQNAFDSSAASVQQALDKLDEVLDILSADPLVYAMASNDPKDITYIKRLEDTDKLALTFQHLRKLSGVARIRLYADNEYLYASGQNNILQASEVSETDWYQTACRDSRRSWFSPADFAGQPEEEQHLFSAMQVIYNPRAVMEPLAVLRADADTSFNILTRLPWWKTARCCFCGGHRFCAPRTPVLRNRNNWDLHEACRHPAAAGSLWSGKDGDITPNGGSWRAQTGAWRSFCPPPVCSGLAGSCGWKCWRW